MANDGVANSDFASGRAALPYGNVSTYAIRFRCGGGNAGYGFIWENAQDTITTPVTTPIMSLSAGGHLTVYGNIATGGYINNTLKVDVTNFTLAATGQNRQDSSYYHTFAGSWIAGSGGAASVSAEAVYITCNAQGTCGSGGSGGDAIYVRLALYCYTTASYAGISCYNESSIGRNSYLDTVPLGATFNTVPGRVYYLQMHVNSAGTNDGYDIYGNSVTIRHFYSVLADS
jgi:hypothetical protein